jgi:heterogeneous nuclear rnp K-like protein 2
MFVITGLPENNEKALFLLYNSLEGVKKERSEEREA